MRSTIHLQPGDFSRLAPRPEGIELYVFGTEANARRAGFVNQHHHGKHPLLRCYCMSWRQPDQIRGRELARVLVTESAHEWIYNNEREGFNQWAQVEHHAKAMLRCAPMIWIEL